MFFCGFFLPNFSRYSNCISFAFCTWVQSTVIYNFWFILLEITSDPQIYNFTVLVGFFLPNSWNFRHYLIDFFKKNAFLLYRESNSTNIRLFDRLQNVTLKFSLYKFYLLLGFHLPSSSQILFCPFSLYYWIHQLSALMLFFWVLKFSVISS